MGKVSIVVCTIVALILLMLFLRPVLRSDSHHQHNQKSSVTERTVHSFPEKCRSEWFKSLPKSTQLNLLQSQRENADGDSFDDNTRLLVEESFNASDADGHDLLHLDEFNEERNMDRDGKTSYKDFARMHCDLAEDDKDATEMIEKLHDCLALYSSINNHDDED